MQFKHVVSIPALKLAGLRTHGHTAYASRNVWLYSQVADQAPGAAERAGDQLQDAAGSATDAAKKGAGQASDAMQVRAKHL